MTSLNVSPPRLPPRRLFGVSSLLVVVLLFLPTLKVCGDPTAPIEFPPVYFPYVCSVLLGVAAFAGTARVRKVLSLIALALWGVAAALVADGALTAHTNGAGFATVAVVFAAAIVVAVRALARTTFGEGAVRGVALGHALLVLAWYGLLSVDHDAMWGAYAGFGLAFVMVVGALGDVAETRAAARTAALPAARVVR